MPHQNTWLNEIKASISELGGYGKYKDIYDKILERNKMDFSINPTWMASVRASIEIHSSDSDVFNGKDDLFYSVSGKGKGIWGLRNFIPQNNSVDITEDDISFPEGKKKLKQHICRERNNKVIKIAKDRFKNINGKLFCEACGFNFHDFYGPLGEDFIEGHHLIPVSELNENDQTKPEDIILLCSNCHKMIHRRRPWLSKQDLKELIEN